jgi:hypothetical protein
VIGVPRIVIECDTGDDLGIVRRAIERDISAHEQRVDAYRDRMTDDRMACNEHELTVLRGAKTEITNAELDCRFGPGHRPMREPDRT